MSRFLRWIGIVLLVLLGLGLLTVAGLYLGTQARYNKNYDIQPAAVAVTPDADLLAQAEVLAQDSCARCHGLDMGGQMLGNSIFYGRAPAPNLTTGAGGVATTYSGEDWARAVLHGVGPDGWALVGMPSQLFSDFEPETLGMLVVYLESLPPVDNDLPSTTVGPLSRYYFITGRDPHLAAELINHEELTNPAPDIPAETGNEGE